MPFVFLAPDADGVADDAVVVCAEGEEAVAELLRWDEVGFNGFEVEEGGREGGGGCRGCYAAIGYLVEDFRAWVGMLVRIVAMRDWSDYLLCGGSA